MATSRKLAILGTLMAGTMLFTACSGNSKGTGDIKDSSAEAGFQETGFPIVKNQLTLKFSGTKTALAPD